MSWKTEKVAKFYDLDCASQLEKIKANSNYIAMNKLKKGEPNHKLSKNEYSDIVNNMNKYVKKSILTPQTLFLFGLPARRGNDLNELYIVDSVDDIDSDEKNYIVRGDKDAEFIWNVQKTDKDSNYSLSEFSFLKNFDEIVKIISNLPVGRFVDGYYQQTVELTGYTPTNWRHWCFDNGKINYTHKEWLTIIKAMNSSISQATIYCS